MKIKPSILSMVILLGFSAGIFAVEKNSAGNAFTFSTSPSESVLLLDDHAVARTKNLTQKFFPAGKHPANPVMRRSEPWEGVGPYVFCNRLMQDEKTANCASGMWGIGLPLNMRWVTRLRSTASSGRNPICPFAALAINRH
ncbi:MAG: hypothetical protein ACR2H1_11810 [Limisphaerales bacterium]